MWTHYLQPGTLDETLALLAQHRENARLIAGGTDLLIEIERKLRSPSVVIDVSRIAGLAEIRIADGIVRIGAGVTHNQVVAHSLLRERAYALVRACWEVGAPQIRNRGTLGGNLVTASPANDTITPLWALGATVTLRSTRGARNLSFAEFFKGVRRTALAADELLTEIAFPLPSENVRSTFLKLGLRRAQAISVINVAVILEIAEMTNDQSSAMANLPLVIRRSSITLGSVAPTIVEATDAQQFLMGKTLDDATIDEAARLAMDAVRPIDDVRGTAAYRRAMVGVYVARALRQLRDDTARDDFPAKPVTLAGKSHPSVTDAGAGHPTPNANSELERATGTRNSPIETTINGKQYTSHSGHDKTLLRFLREDLRLTGTKEGCAEGECGACTVFLDDVAVMSCLTPAARAHGATITTIEGVAQNGELHPVQRGFVNEGGVQCGYCTPGFIMSGVKLLEEIPTPARSDIQQAFTGNLCRCTGYAKILKAMETAVKQEGLHAD